MRFKHLLVRYKERSIVFLITVSIVGYCFTLNARLASNLCEIFDAPYLFNPLDDGELELSDDSIAKISRVALIGNTNSLTNIYSVFKNVKDVYLEPNWKEDIYISYANLTKSKLESLTLNYYPYNLYQEIISFGLTQCPKVLDFDEFTNLKYLSIYGHNIGLFDIYKCDSLTSLVLAIDSMPFFPLNIGVLKNLQTLWIHDNKDHSFELQFILLLNPYLQTKFIKSRKYLTDLNQTYFINYNSNLIKTACVQKNIRVDHKVLTARQIKITDEIGQTRIIGFVDKNNHLHGELKIFNSQGKLIEQRFYCHSKPIKTWNKFSDDGRLLIELHHSSIGNPTYKIFDNGLELQYLKFKPGKLIEIK